MPIGQTIGQRRLHSKVALIPKRGCSLIRVHFLKKFESGKVDAWDISVLTGVVRLMRINRDQNKALYVIGEFRNNLAHSTTKRVSSSQFQSQFTS